MGRKAEDLTGKDFGMFHVVKMSDEKYTTESGIQLILWDCVDKDGNEYKLLRQYLKNCPTEYNPYVKKGHSEVKYQENKNTYIQHRVEDWKENKDDIRHQRKKYDLVGQVYGDWEVLEEGEPYQNKSTKYTRRTWRCLCHHILNDGSECGNIEDVLETNLVNGGSSCCKKCCKDKTSIKINSGEIYRKYKVIERITENVEICDSDASFLCECQCKLKSKRVVKGQSLLNKNAPRRCGAMGCDETVCIVDDNRQIKKHICKQCQKMKDISEFKKSVSYTHKWICLKCDPLPEKEEKTKKQKFLEYRYNFYQKRAETKQIDFEFTLEEFDNLTKQPCFYCGEYTRGSKHDEIRHCGIDRIKSEKGYTKDNCVPCCHGCNVMKMDLEPFEFLRKTKKIQERLNNITNALNNKFGLTEEDENKYLEELSIEKEQNRIKSISETKKKRAQYLREKALEEAIEKVK